MDVSEKGVILMTAYVRSKTSVHFCVLTLPSQDLPFSRALIQAQPVTEPGFTLSAGTSQMPPSPEKIAFL